MNLLRYLTRDAGPLSLEQWAQMFFTYQGNTYPIGLQQTLVGGKEESSDFSGLVERAYSANGIVFACTLARMMLFSEARFQWRQIRDGAPGDLFGTPDLELLEHPWPNATTGDLLARMELDITRAGNAFIVRRPGRLVRLEPDWVSIVIGSMAGEDVGPNDIDAEIVGYAYFPGGKRSGATPVSLSRDEVAHYAPIPDPLYRYRGMSWLNPIIAEIQGDSAATSHKVNFFRNGATPNMIVKIDPKVTRDRFLEWVKTFEDRHAGVENAYRTMYLGGGADAKVVGKDLRQLEFKETQGAGETRIAAAAGMHPVIVGLSEGLQGSSLNAGNFASARRLTADKTMRPLWRNVCGSLATIVPPPPRAELWFDTKDIAFLREDEKDASQIQRTRAGTIRQLIEAGFTAKSVIDAVESDDFTRLEHTGLFSVQLQAPGSTKMPEGEAPGESPVGAGTAPETTPGRKPPAAVQPALPPGRSEDLDDLEEAFAGRE